jgi:uncharacterized membrane protein
MKGKNLERKKAKELALLPSVFECYSHSWRQLWKNFLELFVISLVFKFTSNFIVIFYIPMYLIGLFEHRSEFLIFLFPFIAIGVILAIAFMFLVLKPMQFGVAYANLKASRGEKLEIKEMFTPFMDFWNVVLAGFLTTLIVGFGTLFLIIPGIIFACKLILVPYLVIDKKMKASDAIKESWIMTNGYAWKVVGMALLAVPIILAGYICLIVGAFISLMWIYLAFASLYYAVCLEKG